MRHQNNEVNFNNNKKQGSNLFSNTIATNSPPRSPANEFQEEWKKYDFIKVLLNFIGTGERQFKNNHLSEFIKNIFSITRYFANNKSSFGGDDIVKNYARVIDYFINFYREDNRFGALKDVKTLEAIFAALNIFKKILS